mgnify:CR=1 FL=1
MKLACGDLFMWAYDTDPIGPLLVLSSGDDGLWAMLIGEACTRDDISSLVLGMSSDPFRWWDVSWLRLRAGHIRVFSRVC